MNFYSLLFVLLISGSPVFSQTKKTTVDICIYGGTSSGVIAAYTAKQMGKSVILIEPGKRLGGLSAGGLGYTDIGNKYAISGLALDFYRRIGKHYGKFEQWIFEPGIAEDVFKEYIHSANIEVLFSWRLKKVIKEHTSIKEIIIENADNRGAEEHIAAKVFIDCSYEGDLMAGSGVSYIVGRESNDIYHETYNGVQLRDKHQFPDGIDPYVQKGNPQSGLLWGISNEPMAAQGSGDKKVQAYNFRICLTDSFSNQILITRPEGYDSTRYELLLRVLEKEPDRPFDMIMKPDYMPNRKTDINNNGPFSTDMIGMNYHYADADYEERKKIQTAHELYTKGFLYFIGHDKRMPEHLRSEMLKWGYPKDEYIENDNWSPQLYIREARRMIGSYVMTQANCEGKEKIEDGVGMAAYTMDSHNCQRIVIEKNGIKMVKNEGDVQVGGFPPYPVSYRSLIPKEKECTNLLVPVCLSASHIAYGSIRMEPVFMVMGQSAAVAASLAIDAKSSVQKVNVKRLQNVLQENPLANRSQPDILIDNEQAENILIQGKWEKNANSHRSYAASLLQTNGNEKDFMSVKFRKTIPFTGKYKIYNYVPEIENLSPFVAINISDGKKIYPVFVNLKTLKVQGQTSGEWMYIGEYHFSKGDKCSIEITNKDAKGRIAADAIILVPQK